MSLSAQGKHGKAEKVQREVLAVQQRELGAEISLREDVACENVLLSEGCGAPAPDTLRTRSILAVLLPGEGKHAIEHEVFLVREWVGVEIS